MPHIIKEHHLNDLCGVCKKPHRQQDIKLVYNHHLVYELIICASCGYEIIRLKEQKEFTDRLNFM